VLDNIGTKCLDGIIDRVQGLGVGQLLAQPLADEPIPQLLPRAGDVCGG
jgi:hypothetical protein